MTGRFRLEPVFNPEGLSREEKAKGLMASIINNDVDPKTMNEASNKLWGCCWEEGNDEHSVDRFLERNRREVEREREKFRRIREEGMR